MKVATLFFVLLKSKLTKESFLMVQHLSELNKTSAARVLVVGGDRAYLFLNSVNRASKV